MSPLDFFFFFLSFNFLSLCEALANMDPMTQCSIQHGSSSTPTNAAGDLGLGIEDDGAESDGSGSHSYSDGDYDMEEDLHY